MNQFDKVGKMKPLTLEQLRGMDGKPVWLHRRRTDMDYKELAADLLSGCEENCANCEYAGDSEFECTIAQLAATAITDLLARAEAAEARAEKAERERDAAVKWIKEFTESIDPPCVACKHDTGDYVALGVCGGCSKDNSKWEWDGKEATLKGEQDG